MAEMRSRIAALPDDQRALLISRLRQQQATTSSATEQYDVVIVGGGAAGMTLALELKRSRPATRILVLEKENYPVPETTHKVGESTVEIAAHYLRDILGLEDHLRDSQLRKFGLRMFFSSGENVDIAQRMEVGPTDFPPLATYQLDRGRLENELHARLAREQIEFIDGCKVTELALGQQDALHRVEIQNGDGQRVVLGRWLVDASGRARLLQRQLGVGLDVGHVANAAWLRIDHAIDIKEWASDPAWQARVSKGDRALSTNHLMGPGYWVWLIRLSSGSTSVGIVADEQTHPFSGFNRLDRAISWLREHEPQCADVIEKHQDKIQDFRRMGHYSYSCRQVYSGEGRWCLTGEAGIFLDPLYSPGLDLIAISNRLVTDLVTRDLDGENVQGRAAVHDRLFLTTAQIWLAVYEKQYQLMGNANIMASKVIWDTAFYWGVFGHLYFHDQFHTLADSPKVADQLQRLALLSNRVQAFFREWSAISRPEHRPGLVDLYSPLDFMVRLHHGMATTLSPKEAEDGFGENLRLFEQLAGQLVSSVLESYASQPSDAAVFQQIQRWQLDPLITEVVAAYRRGRKNNPTSDGWIVPEFQQLAASR